jgi:histidine triad (HIT) family protein
MSDCLFCKIVNREIPASIVYEDDRVLAFTDINPQAPTHELARRAAAIAKERGISAGGFRTVFNTNRDAGQTVFHIHLHLIGGRSLAWPPG